MKKSDATRLVIYGLVLVNVMIHLAVYGNFEHHRDELLYFSLGMHPALGYAREYGTTVYLCENPRSSFNEFWKAVTERVGVNW